MQSARVPSASVPHSSPPVTNVTVVQVFDPAGPVHARPTLGSQPGKPAPHAVPDRAPDHVVELATAPNQALIYRLSGDFNPLHVDPAVASAAGFPRPILHGLCTFGVAGRAVLAALCDNDPNRLKRQDARFSSPEFPGETIRTEIWREGDGRAAYRSVVVERDKVVLGNGLVEFL